jgi:hypothetical protein
VANTDVLSHLETGDLVVLALWNRDIAVIHAENSALLLGDTSLAETVVSPGSLVAAKSDTGNLSAKVDTGKLGQSSPAASNIKHALVLLKVNLLANDGKLVILELLKGLLLGDVGNNARGVNHTWAKEPPIEIIASVIVISDLLLICQILLYSITEVEMHKRTLRASVHNDFRCELEEDELEQADGESKAGPVGTVLEDLEAVAVELNIALKVHVVEGLDWDLGPSAVLELIGIVLEGEVVLDRATRKSHFLILAGAESRVKVPERNQERDRGEETEKNRRLQTATDFPGRVCRHNEQQ